MRIWEPPSLRAGLGLLCLVLGGCRQPHTQTPPSIEFTRLPPMGEGSPEKVDAIEGRVSGAKPGQRIVLYARSGVWWVQPTARQPHTDIQRGSIWKNVTHPGVAYAALLVQGDYRPPATIQNLPEVGGGVLAVAVADESKLERPKVLPLEFSGYLWEVRRTHGNRGGSRNEYDTSNAWTDANGLLHLRIARKGDQWTSAEVTLAHSLGYGSYRFVVRDVSKLEPAAVLNIFTWDEAGPPREMNLEISRWGESAIKNAQYVIQPYFVPANVFRFQAPPGVLTHTLQWEPGRIAFRSARGAGPGATSIASHTFTSGVPTPGNEAVHINFYVYSNKRNPMRNGAEVIIEKFEYLP